MTFPEVEMTCKGYEQREARRKEIERFHAVMYHNVHSDRKITAQELYPLATDGARALMTKEEYDEANKYFEKVVWESNNLKQT